MSKATVYRKPPVRAEVAETVGEKICRCCLVQKNSTEFYPNLRFKDGRTAQCRDCILAKRREGTEKQRGTPVRPATWQRSDPQGTRWCSKCDCVQPEAMFGQHSNSRGLARTCKVCRAIDSVALEKRKCAADPGRSTRLYEKHRDKLLARGRAQYASNKEAKRKQNRLWAQANRPKLVEYLVKRRLQEKRQTPSWADRDLIALAYVYSAVWSQVTKIAHQVDHIVPLNSRFGVRGFHSQDNLRIVPATENLKKQDRYWPDTVAAQEAFN